MVLRTGAADSTLDDKGRVNIPIRFREQFQGELVITWGIERCAWIMIPDVWVRFENAIRNSEIFKQEERLILEDKHLNQAQVVALDRAGRIPIAPTIRRYANLERECMVIRSENRLSVWDTATYYAYLTEKDSLARDAMNKLGQDIFRGASI